MESPQNEFTSLLFSTLPDGRQVHHNGAMN